MDTGSKFSIPTYYVPYKEIDSTQFMREDTYICMSLWVCACTHITHQASVNPTVQDWFF